MIAVAVLGIGAVSVIVAVHETTTAAERVRERERTIRDAGRFLEAVALWPVSDLVLRLGERPQGPWRLRIARPSPTLYEITLADSVGRPLLHTAVFRTSDDTTSGGGDAE